MGTELSEHDGGHGFTEMRECNFNISVQLCSQYQRSGDTPTHENECKQSLGREHRTINSSFQSDVGTDKMEKIIQFIYIN